MGAKLKEVPRTLEHLSRLLEDEKFHEGSARQARISLEEEIASHIPGEDESTTNATGGEYKIKVTRKLTRSLDTGIYKEVLARDADTARKIGKIGAVKEKLVLDLKAVKAIEVANPELYAVCAEFITTKPAKVAVKVEKVEVTG